MQISYKFLALLAEVTLFNAVDGMVFRKNNVTSHSQPIRVACLGDSITKGSPGTYEHSYPARLQEMLGNGYLVGNYGRDAATILTYIDLPQEMHDMGIPDAQEYQKETKLEAGKFKGAVAMQPDIVVVMLGTNDANSWTQTKATEYVRRYTDLIKLILGKMDSVPKVFLGIEPPCFSSSGTISATGHNCLVINTVLSGLIRQVAVRISGIVENGMTATIDTWTPIQQHCPDLTNSKGCDWMDDDVHPNADGYRSMAEAVKNAIT